MNFDPDDNVVALGTKFKEQQPEDKLLVIQHGCSHYGATYLVDETLAEVTCSRCQAKLNPMFVLTQLAHKERRWHESFERYQEEMKRLTERSRTKCEHCKQMTKISRN